MNIKLTTLTVLLLVCFASTGIAQENLSEKKESEESALSKLSMDWTEERNIPKEMRGQGVSVLLDGKLVRGIGSWATLARLADYENDKKLTRCRLYGFGKINRGKTIDITITDKKSLELLKFSIHGSNCFRPIVADLENWGGAADGDFLGIMLIESNEHKCVVGVAIFGGFSCGLAYANGKTGFYSWSLASLLKELLKENGCQLNDGIFKRLSGQKSLERGKSDYVKFRNKK